MTTNTFGSTLCCVLLVLRPFFVVVFVRESTWKMNKMGMEDIINLVVILQFFFYLSLPFSPFFPPIRDVFGVE